MGRVEIAESSLGGLTEAEAFNVVGDMEFNRLAREVAFSVDGTLVMVQPGVTGLNIERKTSHVACCSW